MSESAKRVVCPACLKTFEQTGAAFCPFCGKALPQQAAPEQEDGLTEEARALLKKAGTITNLYERRKVLWQARELCPDNLTIETELLFIGNIPEKKRTLDFSIIKSYLLHMYVEPKEVGVKNFPANREELQHGEQLRRCLALASDPDAYLRMYLSRLSDEYIRIFLKESSRYVQSFLSFRIGKLDKQIAVPVNRMLSNISADTELEPEFRALLASAVRGAYKTMFGTDEWLNA